MSRPVLCLVVFGIKVTGSRGEGGVSNKGALYDSFSHIFNDFSLCHPCQLTCDLLHCDYDSDLISHIMANCLIVGSKTIYYICNITVKQEYNTLWKHGCVVWSIVWPASVKPPDHYTTSPHVLVYISDVIGNWLILTRTRVAECSTASSYCLSVSPDKSSDSHKHTNSNQLSLNNLTSRLKFSQTTF